MLSTDLLSLLLRPTTIAIPIFATLIAAEAAWSRHTGSDTYNNVKDTWTNILLGFMSVIWGALFGLGAAVIYTLAYQLAPYKFPADAWWSWALLVFVDDFAYYVFHRACHEVRFMWNFHVVHHSSDQYNLSVAVRQSWFSGIVHWIFYLPIMLIGFAPWMFAVVHGFNLIYQFWIHTRLVGKLGIAETVLNTPSHHRLHHAINPQYLDKNYGGIFIFWDRLFKTFVKENEEPRYGIIRPLASYNALWINLHGWSEMLEEVRRRSGFRERLSCVFGSPYMYKRES